MAVCVMASCGGDKKNGGNNAGDNTGNNTEQNDNAGQNDNPQGVQAQAGDVKTPGDLMTMSTALLNQVADNVEKATNADQVIDAVEVFVNGTINLYNNHAADFKAIDEKYTEEELAEKFPNESAAMEKASNRMGRCMENAMQRCEFTQEQQERLTTVLMKMAELDI